MILKIKALGLILPLALLAGCGSGDNKKDDFDGKPFIRFTVNTVRDANSITVQRTHQDVDDVDVFSRCGPITLTDGRTITYLNGDDFTSDKYCDSDERNALEVNIAFTVQLINNTYEDYKLDYTGYGFAVQVHEFDESAPDNLGDMVWHSDHYFQRETLLRQQLGDDVEDFDANQSNSIVLGPLEAFPRAQSSNDFGRVATFSADQNFIGRPADGGYTFDANNLYHWPSTANDGLEGACDWVAVEDDTSTSQDIVIEKVICQFYSLLPAPSDDTAPRTGSSTYPFETAQDDSGNIKYIAKVSFNFNSGEFSSPEDILITITPP